jgi:hypothetical protein
MLKFKLQNHSTHVREQRLYDLPGAEKPLFIRVYSRPFVVSYH